MIQVTVTAEFGDDAEELFQLLSAVRSWDRARPEVKAIISVNAPNFSSAQMRGVYERLTPPFPEIVSLPLARPKNPSDN